MSAPTGPVPDDPANPLPEARAVEAGVASAGLVRDPFTGRRRDSPGYATAAQGVVNQLDQDLHQRLGRRVETHAARSRRRPVALPVPGVPLSAEARIRRWIPPLVGLFLGGCFLYLTARTRPPVAPPVELPAPAVQTASVEVEATEPPLQLTEETHDAEGQPTRIVGGDPASVLETYCRAGGTDDPRVPLGIRDDPAGQRGIRLGVLRRAADPVRDYALWIRFDSRTSKWFVGDDHHPVEAQPLDH